MFPQNNTLQLKKGLNRWVRHDFRALKVPKMGFYFISTLLLYLDVWNVSTRHCVSHFSNYFLEWHSVN